MKFISTRGEPHRYSWGQALERGLAADGGLLVPEVFPRFHREDLVNFNFHDLATVILTPFLGEEMNEHEISALVQGSFRFPIPLKELSPSLAVLELFHGPTAAFKDVAAQFLGEALSLQASRRGDVAQEKPKTILVATSGDTGGAVAAAFNGRPGFRVVILFPRDGVSPLQRHQLTCWGKNIISLAVNGTFDDCQKIVKSLLAQDSQDSLVAKFGLTSANSISIGRLLPQTLYYAWSSLQWWGRHREEARFVIPTGNMGNAVAAFWARAMGFPIQQVLMATNANRILPEYFASGIWQPKASRATLANAMDVGNPSNFERYQHLLHHSSEFDGVGFSESVDDDEIKSTIQSVFRRWGEFICPHTATAFALAQRHSGNHIAVATAHAAKFSEIVEPLVGVPVSVPESLRAILQHPSSCENIEAAEDEVLRWL